MAVETLNNGDRKHLLIKIGNQKGGLCSQFGIEKEKYVKLWKCLACSLDALAAVTHCNIFLNEDNVAVVGSAVFNVKVRKVVEDCIVNEINPETRISKFTLESLQKHLRNYGAIELQQPNVDDIGMEKCGPCYGKQEVTAYSSTINIGREKEVQEAWSLMHGFLKRNGISCALHTAERTLTVSTTRRTMNPDIIDHVGGVLEVLARSSIPATKAAKL